MGRTVRIREQLVELDGGEMVLCPPKSRAAKRVVGIPGVVVVALTTHLETFVDNGLTRRAVRAWLTSRHRRNMTVTGRR